MVRACAPPVKNKSEMSAVAAETFGPNKVIYSEGDPATAFFILVNEKGKVKVRALFALDLRPV